MPLLSDYVLMSWLIALLGTHTYLVPSCADRDYSPLKATLFQDLKDMMRKEGEATYCDAHKKEKNLALVCFASHSDLKRAIKAYQGKDINGRKIKLIDDTQSGGGRSRSRSRSHSPRSRRRRSPSRSKSPRDSRSRSPASRSKSKSRSPASQNGRDSRSRSPPAKRSSHSRSGSATSSVGSKK